MKKYLQAGPWLAVALGALALPDSASASLRWRTDGNACRPYFKETYVRTHDNSGLSIEEAPWNVDVDAVTCAIPIGPATVDLEGLGNRLDEVDVWLEQSDVAAKLMTMLVVHDYDGDSACGCGLTNEDMNPGDFDHRTMPFDCGSCSYASDWAATLHISRAGGGRTYVNVISVHD